MMRREARDRKTRKPVAKTALEYKAANECGRPRRSHAEDRRAASFFKHLLCCEWRVTLADHAVMMRGVGRRVVEQVAGKLVHARTRIHADRFVNVTLFPTAFCTLEQAQLFVRIPAAAANPALLIESTARDQITVRRLRHVFECLDRVA